MKRKLAFFLAVVMTLSLLPFNTAMAASSNRLQHEASNVYENTLLIENNWVPEVNTEIKTDIADANGDVDYIVDGNDLIITGVQQLSAGDTIRLHLTNAEWLFRADSSQTANTGVDGYFHPERLNYLYNRYMKSAPTYEKAGGGTYSVAGITNDFFASVKGIVDNSPVFSAAQHSTYQPEKGIWYVLGGSEKTQGHYIRFAQPAPAGAGTATYPGDSVNRDGTIINSGRVVGKLEVPYDLAIDYSDNSFATLTVLEGSIGPYDGQYKVGGSDSGWTNILETAAKKSQAIIDAFVGDVYGVARDSYTQQSASESAEFARWWNVKVDSNERVYTANAWLTSDLYKGIEAAKSTVRDVYSWVLNNAANYDGTGKAIEQKYLGPWRIEPHPDYKKPYGDHNAALPGPIATPLPNTSAAYPTPVNLLGTGGVPNSGGGWAAHQRYTDTGEVVWYKSAQKDNLGDNLDLATKQTLIAAGIIADDSDPYKPNERKPGDTFGSFYTAATNASAPSYMVPTPTPVIVAPNYPALASPQALRLAVPNSAGLSPDSVLSSNRFWVVVDSENANYWNWDGIYRAPSFDPDKKYITLYSLYGSKHQLIDVKTGDLMVNPVNPSVAIDDELYEYDSVHNVDVYYLDAWALSYAKTISALEDLYLRDRLEYYFQFDNDKMWVEYYDRGKRYDDDTGLLSRAGKSPDIEGQFFYSDTGTYPLVRRNNNNNYELHVMPEATTSNPNPTPTIVPVVNTGVDDGYSRYGRLLMDNSNPSLRYEFRVNQQPNNEYGGDRNGNWSYPLDLDPRDGTLLDSGARIHASITDQPPDGSWGALYWYSVDKGNSWTRMEDKVVSELSLQSSIEILTKQIAALKAVRADYNTEANRKKIELSGNQLRQVDLIIATLERLLNEVTNIRDAYKSFLDLVAQAHEQSNSGSNDYGLIAENTDYTVSTAHGDNADFKYIYNYLGSRWEVRIPLVSLAGDAGDVKVEIISAGTTGNITANSHLYGVASASSTKTTTDETVTARDEFPVDFVITENRLGSLNTGAFTISAPVGFEWAAPYLVGPQNSDPDRLKGQVAIGLDGGLDWRSNTIERYPAGDRPWVYGRPSTGFRVGTDQKYFLVNGTSYAADESIPYIIPISATQNRVFDYYLGYLPTGGYVYDNRGVSSGLYSYDNGDPNYYNRNMPSGNVAGASGWAVDRSVLIVVLNGLVRSGQSSGYTKTGVPGKLFIKGLTMVADESAPFGDIYLEIKDLKDSGVTEETKVFGGTRADWVLTLKALGELPTLVSGRYATSNSILTKDTDHKTAKVHFSENSTNAWWAGRVTNFTLNPEAKYRKVKFDTADELSGSLEDYLLDAKEGNDVNKMFMNDGRKYSKLSFSGNVMTLTNFQVNVGKKAVIEFQPYVSIQPGFEGPITIGVDGSGVPNDGTAPGPARIAEAVSPITVSSEQKDILIGYQWQKTDDIIIKEHSNGMLRKDEEVRITITDGVSNDVVFGPDVKPVISEKGFKMADWTTTSTGLGNVSGAVSLNGGTIVFRIAQVSIEPTTLTLENISIKIDRSVPVSNARPYEAIVWGNAVAANYAYESEANRQAKDTFVEFGPNLKAAYLRVVTSANDQGSLFTQEVRVPNGANYYLVNGVTCDMPDAKAYINASNSSMYVPIRFVSRAFGMPDDKIMYDRGVVTIVHPQRIIQFTVGDTNMVVNGTTVPMLNAAGVPIAPETKDSGDGFVRVYVPFRSVGDAFGVRVSYNSERQEAIYNEGAQDMFLPTDVSNQ